PRLRVRTDRPRGLPDAAHGGHMALLSRRPRSRRALRWSCALMVLLALAAAGCAMFGFGAGERPFAFRHALHGSAAGLDCRDCPRTVERADAPGMPLPSQCQLCHKKLDAEKPPEKRVETLFDGRTFRRTPREHLAGEVLFSHQKHVTYGTQCT